MQYLDINRIKLLLNSRSYYPSKKLGQNFLTNQDILSKIADFAEKQDTIVEVGAGIGNLTLELAKRSKKVIAIEKDNRMIEVAKDVLSETKNVKIVEGDVLEILKSKDVFSFIKGDYKVIANLPYNVGTAIIREFLEIGKPPREMILMIQKEVAQRICANPPKMSLLSVSVQFYAEVKILFKVSRNCFWPMPNVDSAVIRIVPFDKNEQLFNTNTDLFFKIVRAGFSRPRAQLLNNFSNELKLDKKKIKIWLINSRIDPAQRAETLSVQNWIQLTINYEKNILEE